MSNKRGGFVANLQIVSNSFIIAVGIISHCIQSIYSMECRGGSCVTIRNQGYGIEIALLLSIFS